MMDKFLDSIIAQLGKSGDFEFTRTNDSISVPASGADGFLVTVWGDQRGEFVVNYGHYWHGHFPEEEQAAAWFLAGVNGQARLKCAFRWRYLVNVVVEKLETGGWVTADTTGSCLSVLVWWLPKQVLILSNSIKMSKS